MYAASAASCQTVDCECFVSNTMIWQHGLAGSLNMSLEYVQARWVWRILLARAALTSYGDFKSHLAACEENAARAKATMALIKAVRGVMHF